MTITAVLPALNKISLTHLNGSPIRDILSQAEENRLNIKYLKNQLYGYNIGVVVPTYNEEQLIEKTINGIPEYVKKIYLIDDCSTDSTPDIIKRMTDPRIISVRHEKNRGVGAAIVTGYKLALEDDMDIVAVMAGDNQMDPGQLPNMLDPIVEGKADFTKGNRISRGYWKGMSKWRLLGNFLLTWLNKIASGYWNISDPQNGYVAISVSSLRKFNLDSLYERFAFENDMMIKANMLGIRMMNVTIPARYGEEKSKIKYGTFIIDTSWFLLESFLRRIWTKYIKEHNPVGHLYLLSFILILTGIPLVFLLSLVPFVFGTVLFLLACSLEKWQNKERG